MADTLESEREQPRCVQERQAPTHAGSADPGRTPRVHSIDIFRGINIALMIFVNELAGIGGLPWWTHHAPAAVNVMTYVDMVFPAFLFIIGMSLPLALNARIRRGATTPKLVTYIVLRSFALIVLGLVLENASNGNAGLMHGLRGPLWGSLALLGACLLWMDYPAGEDPKRQSIYRGLRALGFALLATLIAFYRRVDPSTGNSAWLNFAYPEILGSIGYSYLVTGLAYLTTRRWRWAPLGWFLAFLALNILSSAHVVRTSFPWWIWPVQNGSKPALIFAGVLASTLFFLEPRCRTFAQKAVTALVVAFVAALLARRLSPLGISKIRATPTWVLYNIAACAVIYSLLYFVADVKQHVRWAAPFRSAGSNTLLTYLLPDLWSFGLAALTMTWWSHHLNYGLPGVLRAFGFTIFILAVSTLLTRRRIRLQL